MPYHASVLLAPGSGLPGLLLVLFLLGGFGLFRGLLPLSFGLVLLPFLVAHGMPPFWGGSGHFVLSAGFRHLCPRENQGQTRNIS